MKVFYIFTILVFLIYTISAQGKANTGKKYTVGVYILCDEPMTKQLQGRSKEEYFGAFFSVINLIFQQLPSSIPMVKFKVVKIETESELKALKQAYQYLPSSQKTNLYGLWPQHINLTSGQVADTPTTKQLSEYFKETGKPYNNSHVIVLFSGRTLLLYRVYHDYGNTDAHSRLLVHTNPKRAGICTKDNIVITQDDGFFSGVMFTARRLARLLGANYDLAKNTTCLYSSSMLMGDMDKKENYTMSPCTIQDLKTTLESDQKQSCLEKEFDSSVTPTQMLPADLFSPDSYCAHKYKGQENAGECTQAKWDISGYPSPGPCKVRCCYGTPRSFRRYPHGMYDIDALYGYSCKANGRQDGVCIKEVCVKKSS